MTSTKCVQWACLLALVVCVSACSSAASVGAGVATSVAQAVGTSAGNKAAQRKAEEQAEIQAFEEAQAPSQAETEGRYLQMVEQMQRQGLWFASLAHIDALEARWSVSDGSRLLRADALRHAGQQQSSQTLYQALLKTPQSARALHGLGLLAASQGDFVQAVQHMEAAQKTMPTDALLLNDLGYAMLHTEQAVGAGLPLKKAAQLQPQNVRIQSNLAVFLVLYGRDGEAQAWMAQHGMTEVQRMGVFERAQSIAGGRASPSGGIAVELRPERVEVSTDRQQKCSSCLIFESQLASAPPDF